MNQYLDIVITRKEKVSDEVMLIHTDKDITIKLVTTYIGTYRNDNVKWLKENLTVGQKIDVVWGEQGWAINTYPKRKAYYQQQTKFINDESSII